MEVFRGAPSSQSRQESSTYYQFKVERAVKLTLKQQGMSLAMLLQRRKLSRESLIHIIEGLVNEAHKLHSANICINYITLQNIFVDSETYRVYILDFRNAKIYFPSGAFEWRDDLA